MAGGNRRTLKHYTDEAGHKGMLDSGEIWASGGPIYARYGDGQYFSDIFPGTIGGLKKADLTPGKAASGQISLGQLSTRFFRIPYNTGEFGHYIEIDATILMSSTQNRAFSLFLEIDLLT